ncbi:hypothetical protein L211DRAFT_838525 [Terfezia boudieri ATCC MYA-4762]|uniref:Uncharacterized protein n=1 Tax=Terfezia boudieri ATCC MYA-4762 TaxID=1051890 RepID=A0A3N4LPU5_9PEZI|nr:hypothetical protein L211DRAFT_838525 [Terfezia boudieri ATCC MYA-4762]
MLRSLLFFVLQTLLLCVVIIVCSRCLLSLSLSLYCVLLRGLFKPHKSPVYIDQVKITEIQAINLFRCI